LLSKLCKFNSTVSSNAQTLLNLRICYCLYQYAMVIVVQI
jgi:hypothetical protein